jgi:hypothetical protein
MDFLALPKFIPADSDKITIIFRYFDELAVQNLLLPGSLRCGSGGSHDFAEQGRL